MKTQTAKRLESFLWRSGMMSISFIVDGFLTYFTTARPDDIYFVVAGLALGELSKYIHSKMRSSQISE